MFFLLLVVGSLCLLAIFDLFVGVSNDAVNFLNSAIGSRVASFNTILVVASCGVLVGALMSNGMMDIARHGVMHPSHFTMMEVITIFMAVMASDIFVLDCFNNWGLPTSTTVSLVFELLGATIALAIIKIVCDPNLSMAQLCNSEKALQMIIAIFVSVAIAFVAGTIVQWVTRLAFSFRIGESGKWLQVLFATLSFSILSYFVLMKGLGKSPWLPGAIKTLMAEQNPWMYAVLVGASLLVAIVLILKKVNIFSAIIMYGTFALAMAFASNDLVNFIGVPMAGLDSFQTWYASNTDPSEFMMVSLEQSANTPVDFLAGAAVIMIVAMATSKKARHVVATSVNLSRQDESDEMFGSSRAARGIVGLAQRQIDWLSTHTPAGVKAKINNRFTVVPLENEAAFDGVRASVNLVLASSLIVIGTLWKLPLSTTYVTFMVAMGTSLADRAWGRESAVYRITGMLSVVGGWLLTAGMAFFTAAIVCVILYYGGFAAMLLAMIAVGVILIRSSKQFNNKHKASDTQDMEQLMLRSRDGGIVQELLCKYYRRQQCMMARKTLEWYEAVVEGLKSNKAKPIRRALNDIEDTKPQLKKYRKRAFLGLKRAPADFAMERNTWFHLGFNADQQWIYSMKRMTEPILEHIDNGFKPFLSSFAANYETTYREVVKMLKASIGMMETRNYDEYRELLESADIVKGEIAVLRRKLLDTMQNDPTNENYNISLVYLNLLQETQEIVSIMRHQLRATRKFLSDSAAAA